MCFAHTAFSNVCVRTVRLVLARLGGTDFWSSALLILARLHEKGFRSSSPLGFPARHQELGLPGPSPSLPPGGLGILLGIVCVYVCMGGTDQLSSSVAAEAHPRACGHPEYPWYSYPRCPKNTWQGSRTCLGSSGSCPEKG